MLVSQSVSAIILAVVGLASFRATHASPSIAKRATCTPTSAGDAGADDVPAIEAAFASCGNGGIIVIPAGKTYAIRSTLSFAGCKNCDFQVEGTLKMSDDLDYWNGKQAVFLLDGITYWTEFNSDSSYARPTLMYIDGSSGVTVSNLYFKNAPNVFHSVTGGSTNVAYTGLRLAAVATSTVTPKNTDGFDVGSSTYVTITNTTVANQDDCVAFKPGANYVTVSDISCSGSHGISVGSLGSKAGNTDTVTNVYVARATMIDSTKAIGIKLYEGGSSHGTATVSNVTFDGVTVQNSDYATQIQSCYDSASTSDCTSNPSTASVTGVYFKNFSGTTSSKYDPVVGNMNCPAAGTCDIYFSGFTVKAPSGKANVACANVDETHA